MRVWLVRYDGEEIVDVFDSRQKAENFALDKDNYDVIYHEVN